MGIDEFMSEIKKTVVKFGGSSLASAEQFKKSAAIILADESRRFVVPSAPGKRFPDDEKVTDMLIACHTAAANGEDFTGLFDRIRERYELIRTGLSLSVSLDEEFARIERNLKSGCSRDYAASRGEYLNGILLAFYLGYEFVDAAQVVFFDENGSFDGAKTNLVMGGRLAHVTNAVVPGFYGSMPDGSVKTFSRGGSDVTGAIVARAVMADIYENWTDVSGFLMADPRIVRDPKPLKLITYRELRELSYMGATVLHEDSIFPVKMAGIPINIRNTNMPEEPGTMIVPSADSYGDDVITGIAGRKGFAVLHIEKDMMNQETGFGMRVLKVLSDMGLCFEHLPSGIDTMGVVIDQKAIGGREREILSEIARATNPDKIEIERDLALIAVVGRGMIKTPGTASRVFSAVASAGINIRMIDQGSSELNIIIGVEEKDFEKAIETVYRAFVG